MASAIKITRNRLKDVESKLNDGTLTPNCGDKANHVFKVICGRGNHSFNGPKIKIAIPKMLDYYGYDFHRDDVHGNFLVKLTSCDDY